MVWREAQTLPGPALLVYRLDFGAVFPSLTIVSALAPGAWSPLGSAVGSHYRPINTEGSGAIAPNLRGWSVRIGATTKKVLKEKFFFRVKVNPKAPRGNRDRATTQRHSGEVPRTQGPMPPSERSSISLRWGLRPVGAPERTTYYRYFQVSRVGSPPGFSFSRLEDEPHREGDNC